MERPVSQLKIAVYTICKNESRFVQRWAASNDEADYRLVCDTGSTDDTVKLLEDNDVKVIPITVSPWRFDSARNTALNLLPKDIDICIWQDLDEELLPGWRAALEKGWRESATIANHRYRHNDGAWQWHSKIHARHGCWWTGAVHETLSWNREENACWIEDFFLDEHQDRQKSRSGYLNLLLKKINEGDRNWRTYFFLANDYQTNGNNEKSIESRIQSYDLCGEDAAVKSYIARNIAKQYANNNEDNLAEKWFRTSVDHSNERESWFSYCEFLYNKQRWDECYIAAKKCLTIDKKPTGFTYSADAWSWKIYDYAALSAYNIGLKTKALTYGRIAVEENPNDERLKNNLNYYEKS